VKDKQVAVALSGGVDSAVAATLLIERGYNVIGVTMRLWKEPPETKDACSPDPTEDAQKVAHALSIPFHAIDVRTPFKRYVVDKFIAEYSAGRTPNPCLYCNRHIKFGYLLQQALGLGAQKLATGHYARIRLSADGQTWQLLKGIDKRKDQSYVLYALGQEELAHVLFPLGERTKDQVREIAIARQLPVAHTEESQDLCFVCDNDYRRFLRRYAPLSFTPGPILNSSGHEIGRHKGLAAYTIGQRSGIGIAASEAFYVLGMNAERNALIAGPKRELGHDHLLAQDVRWVSGRPPAGPVTVTAKIRYRARPVEAVATPLPGDRADVHFAEPLRDITPGQGIVFYTDEVVLGGGIIADGDMIANDGTIGNSDIVATTET
jgi:tRNA-specific 2-thiouridylase